MTANYVSPYITGVREASPTQLETLIAANGFQAVDAWMQFEVDLILFSEMQPSIAATSSNLAQSYTFLALPTNLGFGISTYHSHQ